MSAPDFEQVVRKLRDRVGSGPKVITSNKIASIAYFGDLIEEIRVLPDGQYESFTLVNRTMRLWTVVAAFDAEGYLITVPQLKYGVNEVTIELSPGGTKFMEEGDPTPEKIIPASQEAFLQETGYSGGEWGYLGFINIDDNKFRNQDGNGPLKAHLLIAMGVEKTGEPAPRPTDFYEVVRIAPSEFRQLLDHEWLQEASAVACLQRAFLRMGLLQWSGATED